MYIPAWEGCGMGIVEQVAIPLEERGRVGSLARQGIYMGFD